MTFYLSAIMLGLGFVSLGIGIFISMRIFNIPDITTDGSYTLGAVVTSVMLIKGYSLPLVLIGSVSAGVLAGFATGFVHTRLKVNALLAGILVMTALYSVNLMLMGRSNIPLIGNNTIFDSFPFISDKNNVQLFVLMLNTLLIWGFITWLLKTDFGLAMRATGNSESMIRAQGVNAERMKIVGLGISNGLVALSGSLIAQYQKFTDINMGIGIVILGLGSVMIGETLMNWLKLFKIQYRILGVIIGTIIFRLILAFTLSIGVDPNLLKLVTALFVLLVVALPNLKRKF